MGRLLSSKQIRSIVKGRKVIATINKGFMAERQIDSHQLDQIIDVWWPKLEDRLKALSPPPEPTVARSTEDQLEELLTLARENLQRENLRLEASREQMRNST